MLGKLLPVVPSDTSRCCKHSMTARYCTKCARADLSDNPQSYLRIDPSVMMVDG